VRLSPRERWIGFAATAFAALYVWFTFQPDLVLSPTTANGGDTGAHVWWPAYLRDHVLGKWRLSGWAPDWYAGFPAGHFYFPFPSLLVVLLDVVLPYNVAFKLVTVLGPVMLPVAAYFFARGIDARWPAPPLFAVATLPYLFFTGYTIYGGNLASTLAGEFSFTIALCLGLFFLGALARSLDHRSGFALPAALLAATVMSHIIVAFFAVIAAGVIWLQRRPWANFRVAAAIGGVGALLTAVWTVPLVLRLAYATDMGWTKLCGSQEASVRSCMEKNLMPGALRWAFVLAVVGVITGLGLRRRSTISLFVLAAIFAVAFVVVPETRLWNARLLPFYYLMVMFLAASGTAELAGALARISQSVLGNRSGLRSAADDNPGSAPEEELTPLGPEPADPADAPDPAEPVPVTEAPSPAEREPRLELYAFAVKAVVVFLALGAVTWYTHDTRGFIPAWIRWNYSGYEAKPAYPEFREVIETMAKLPPGRALWEPSSAIDKYGTTLALELLPHFTNGRIGSMEGLYFESAATTPYHFMMVAALAKQPSNPVRGLQYRTITDFDLGVRQMRLMGVRYYMAQSDEAKQAADNHPDLRLVAETGSPSVAPQVARWRIYEVLDSPLVQALANEPVVVQGVSAHGWLKPASAWFDDPSALDRPIAADGPRSWARTTPGAAKDAPRHPLPEVKVTRIESGDDWVRFHVSRTGVPVLVKTSYFPNWKADGAQGPWRVSPNLMVVVPTAKDVSLHYGRTPGDFAGIGLTGLGVAGLVLLARWQPGPLAPPRRRRRQGEPAVDDAAGSGAPEGGSPDEAERSPALAYD
jgi:hypothetical protein